MESRLRLQVEMWESFVFLTLPLLDICITGIFFQSVALPFHFLLSDGCRAACIINPVITLVIKWAVGDVDGREGGHIPKAGALRNAACPPSSRDPGPRKKAQVEKDANNPAP